MRGRQPFHHLNPTVSVGLWAGGRFPASDLLTINPQPERNRIAHQRNFLILNGLARSSGNSDVSA
ncbi:MAG TPA: hypothetical protein DCS21_11415 [Gammaproteobacteria bacterium]|nr:hypothetical protein [Gammaproteobacteria bacterium]